MVCTAHYVETLFGNREMRDALDRLDRITLREGQMALAETRAMTQHTLVATEQILDKINRIGSGE
jgi:hypothetical protein